MTRTNGLRAASVAVGLVTVLGLAACGSSGPKSDSASGGGSGATAWALTGGDEQTFRASFDDWNQAHSSQPVDATFFANDAYKQKVRTAIGAGKPPTLIYGWGGGILKAYVDAGQVADLTADVNADPELKSRYLPSIAASGMIDDKVYAMPNNAMQPVVLYYNKDVFKEGRRRSRLPPSTSCWPSSRS